MYLDVDAPLLLIVGKVFVVHPVRPDEFRSMMDYNPYYAQYYYSKHKYLKREFDHHEDDDENDISRKIRSIGETDSKFK